MEDSASNNPLYVASYLRLRVLVGILGLALPAILLLAELLVLEGSAPGRPSLSSYYHSGARDVFVGILVALGLVLLTYRIAADKAQNWWSSLAGVMLLGVAMFPTSLPPLCHEPGHAGDPICGLGLTQLQQALGEGHVRFIHGATAGLAFASLAMISVSFARDERAKKPGPGMTPAFWARFHMICAGLIGTALVAQVALQVTDTYQEHATMITETVMCAAFGISWLLKGLDLKVLRQARTSQSASRTEGADAKKPRIEQESWPHADRAPQGASTSLHADRGRKPDDPLSRDVKRWRSRGITGRGQHRQADPWPMLGKTD